MGDEANGPPDEGWGSIETAVLPEDRLRVRPEEGAREQAYLIVLAGQRVGEMVRISDEMKVGRAETASFRVLDEGVSRAHMTLIQRGDGSVLLRDTGSSNGTFVNGERVTERILSDGDKIRIGSTVILKFSYSDQLDEQFQQQMFRAAIQDPLTGLYNRRRLDEQLAQEFNYCQRHHTPLVLIMLDIDHFKQVNDTHGHAVGDAVLRGLGGVLSSITRAEDLAARYGGEEFALLCRGLDSFIGAKIAERLRVYVEGARLVPELPGLRVTVSAGVASLPSSRLQSPKQLVEAADRALYLAKQSGRNQVCIAD